MIKLPSWTASKKKRRKRRGNRKREIDGEDEIQRELMQTTEFKVEGGCRATKMTLSKSLHYINMTSTQPVANKMRVCVCAHTYTHKYFS